MSKSLRKFYVKLRHLAVCESGQDLIEYGLLTTVIALACISSVQGAANSVNQMFGQVTQAFVSQPTSSQ